jgi:2-polyprenyl-3-methyl-5-hydroxy-6-metoxy-1,4-benzoquinol methylase
MEQPTRSKSAPREERRFDQTSLRENGHGQLIHRDYAAHFFRWGFAKKNYIQHDVTEVLDVGCGPDLPLMKVLLGGGPHLLPKHYTGVDMNGIRYKGNPGRATILGSFNFIEEYPKLKPNYDLITNFEVIEHMAVNDGLRMLQIFKQLLSPNGHILLSTPVFNGSAARNHIHEYTIPELWDQVELAGLRVIKRFGTFANWHEIRKVAKPEHLATLEALKTYYDGEVLSTFLAPLYPDSARNNLWVISH